MMKMNRPPIKKMMAKERAMEHGPKTPAEFRLEKKISKATGKSYVGKR